jgi:hypothetical protein
MINKMSKTERREFWRNHVRSWRASGMSQLGYCRLHGLKSHQLHYYIHEDDRQPNKAEAAGEIASSRREKLFLPVKLEPVTRVSMRVTLENGVSIDFGSGSDPVWVGRVLGSISR